MKKWIFGALAAAVLAGCSSQPKYVITGELGDEVGMVYLRDREELLDSAAVENGVFRMEGTIEEPRAVYLYDNREPAAAGLRFYLILEPGEIRIAPAADEGHYEAVGSPANDACAEVNARRRALMAEYRDEATSDERRGEIVEEFTNISFEGAKRYSDNLFGVTLLQDVLYYHTAAELQELIDGFTPALQNHPMMEQIKEYVAKKFLTEVGQPCIDFEQPTADGGSMTLLSVVQNPANKYTLLDFWASWCGPCMAEVPALKAAYDAYHAKGFEIFGVSLDNSKERWQEAIATKGLNWLHVSDLQGWQNAAAADYGVRSIPANYLIDAEGKIVATNLRGEELAEKLAELLD